MTTHAVVTDGIGTNRLQPVDLAKPDRGELVLELEACGLCGTDVYKIEQRQADAEGSGEAIVLGHELVGRVVETGEGCRYACGDRLTVAHHVACGRCRLCRAGAETNCAQYKENLLVPGGFSQHILIREPAVLNSAFKLAEGMTAERAVWLEPTACVLRGLSKAAIEHAGRRSIAVFGCGSMGLLHFLVLRATVPEVEIHMVDPSPERRAIANDLGATSASPVLTVPVDAVFDTVGSDEVVEAALPHLRPGGAFVLFAHGRPQQRTGFPSNKFFRAEHRLLATYSSGRFDQVRAWELLNSEVFDPSPLVTHTCTLDSFDQALRWVRDQTALKVIFTR